ncbi:MAG TPA: nuclear transport factor 2 family protein [Woeseiaceae bacterium]|nr:nuclear transport factor 2 family protein [Woeseiaceae bacterium]
MLSREFAETFSKHWIEAWNEHDLEKVLSHYSEGFEMSSPYIAQIAGEPSGTLRGKAAVGAYWSEALRQVPNLRFELFQTLIGADSVTIYYRGVRGPAAEVFFFSEDGLVRKAAAHYA